ncbi:hypothetical protein N7532_008040 [Penicillium argentinense]|uniref:F-box domain-containing protein n=1 Tax=Penicillium argentinense TaxID=1131581 RepID=A0A9W9K1M7_9EURO|nr:uncharacterized protein N7532_008040 [Penicillium argentinense]KAJ5089356.1 hypothetical protein N7532_008040 [Penicillium argentinense]
MASVFARPNMLLVELPTEILSVIFSYIPDSGCLVQIMQVCRLFRDMIEPILYRSMHLQLPLTSTSRDSRGGTYNLGHLAGLIDALSARPQHSRLVKILYLQLDDPKGLDCSYKIKISNLFPHLQELSLSPPSPHLDLTGMLFLKYLRLNFGDMADYPQPVQLILHHFWIPTLRILQIEYLELESQWVDLDPLQRHQTSPIIDLRIHALTDVDQSIGILTSLLNSVKSLKRFTLDAELDAVISHMVHDWLSLDAILCALRFHADTLEDIFIAASDGSSIRRTTPTWSIMLFSSLRKLAIPISCLEYCKGSNCDFALPPKLEELQLQQQECYEEISVWYSCYEGLKALAKRKRDGFPELRLIVWWTQMSIAWFESSKRLPIPPIGTLIRTFEEVDVLFSWITHPVFKGSPFGQAFRPPSGE